MLPSVVACFALFFLSFYIAHNFTNRLHLVPILQTESRLLLSPSLAFADRLKPLCSQTQQRTTTQLSPQLSPQLIPQLPRRRLSPALADRKGVGQVRKDGKKNN